MKSTKNPVPKHVAIVLDGNRRFSKKLMLKPWKGHEWGAKKVIKLIDWCKELGIKELTLYAFSMQNMNRPKKEFDYLMNLFLEVFNNKDYINKIHKNKIRINFIGRIKLFPKKVYQRMLELMEETKKYKNRQINFAMAYGGREEVIDAVKKLGDKIKKGKLNINKLNEEVFSQNLYMDHEPDLIIRTGGDHRTSNFLIWQSHYSEWYFLEKTWPEFEKGDLIDALNNFSARQRRFGK